MSNVKDFLRRKDIVITPQRYLIEALGAMAQGLFASLLIGTIIKTLGQQTGLDVLVDLGGYATAMSGPAMAVAIGWALHCPPLVLFSLVTVGYSSNALGGAGGPLAVLIIAIVAAELGKAVSKETWIAPTLASAITGPLATCVFHMEMNGAAVSSGMGTCGLVGQIGVYTGWVNDIAAGTKAAITPMDWAALVLVCFVLPAVLSVIFCEIERKLGWIKENDLKLN